eukprot:gb/GFBE01039850.1/.p1 GENE.gb/GFBE01039850.1/~~gb/GFBE01039850.1/.p1  ORF type:complete len:608 (+),score=66.25 gb/GFBE01039850.1/:1-1824(+)
MGSRPTPRRASGGGVTGIAKPAAPPRVAVAAAASNPRLGAKVVGSSSAGNRPAAGRPPLIQSSAASSSASGTKAAAPSSGAASSSSSSSSSSASPAAPPTTADVSSAASPSTPGQATDDAGLSRGKRTAKAVAKAAAAAAAEAMLEWSVQEAALAEADVSKAKASLQATCDYAGKTGLEAEGATTENSSPRAGSDGSTQAASRPSIKAAPGSRKKGRRKKGPEPTRTLAFTFSTEVRRTTRRRGQPTEVSQERLQLGARPRVASSSGSASSTGLNSRRASSDIAAMPALQQLAPLSAGLEKSPSEEFAEDDDEEARTVAQMVEDWVEKAPQPQTRVGRGWQGPLAPSAAAVGAPPAIQRATPPGKGSPGLVADTGPLPGNLAPDVPDEILTLSPKVPSTARPPGQRLSPAPQRSHLAGAWAPAPPSTPCAGASSPLTVRRQRRLPNQGAPPPPWRESREDDERSSGTHSAGGPMEEEPLQPTLNERSQSSSIIRRVGLRGEAEDDKKGRTVSFCADTPVEVVQFSVDDNPTTTRGPRRLFGGELQASTGATAAVATPPTPVGSIASQRSRGFGGGFAMKLTAPGKGPATSRLGIRDLAGSPADMAPG